MKELIYRLGLWLSRDRIVLKGRVRLILEDVNTGEKEITAWKRNLIVTTGKLAILRRLGNKTGELGTTADEGQITYGAVGTTDASPLVSDTILGAEVGRKPVSAASMTGNILTLRVFFTTAEGNGALKEFGWFGEAATAAADSGTMFNRINIDKTKDTSKTLTIEQEIEYA